MFRDIKNIMYIKKSMLSLPEYFQIEVHENRNVLKYIDNKYIDTIKKPRIENVDDELVIRIC